MQSLSDNEGLRERFNRVWGDFNGALQEKAKRDRKEVWKHNRRIIFFVGALFILIAVLDNPEQGVIVFGISIGALVVLYLILLEGMHLVDINKVYTRQVDEQLYGMVFRFFDMRGDYYAGIDKRGDEMRRIILSQLKQSELLAGSYGTPTVGDVIVTNIGGNNLVISELQMMTGGETTIKPPFKGLFVSYRLPRTISGTTYISTEGDITGFAHRDFWDRIISNGPLREMVLEWNDFERDLFVATTDEKDARFIFTPDFMDYIHSWWETNRRNIRIVFYDDMVSILFPEDAVKVGYYSPLSSSALKKYAFKTITSIRHVLRLITYMEKRFRE